MKSRTRTTAVAVGTAAVAALGAAVLSAPASAKGGPVVNTVDVRATGLNDPYGIMSTRHNGFVVAENASGQVTRVDRDGHKRVVLANLPGVAAAVVGRGHTFAVLGGPPPPGEGTASKAPQLQRGVRSAGPVAPTTVVRSTRKGHAPVVIANLEKYELRHNPDGQPQFDKNHVPYDALSNPFAMNYSRFGLLVADGGANDVLRVNPRTGHVSTFFVPPTVKDVKACQGPDANANPGVKGCDPVPTGVDVVGNAVYVSTLGAEAPGAGRIYKLDGRTRKVLRVWKGFDAPTGVAVSPQHDIYFSQVLANFPAQGPGPGFDPSTVGQITKLSHGRQYVAAVTMPTGLDYRHHELYSSAWSLANQLGISDGGQIVKVHQRAFTPVPAP